MIKSLCPKCTNNMPTFEINNTQLFLKCSCGFISTYSLHSYLQLYRLASVPHNYNFKCKLHNNLYQYYCENCHFHLCGECLEEYKEDGHHLIKLNDEYFYFMINKGKEHLDYYCFEIKDKLITKLINKIEHVNDIYNKTVELDKNILSFIKGCFNELINDSETKKLDIYNYLFLVNNKEINSIIRDINEIESAYERCYQRNNDIIILLSELIKIL